MSIRLQVPKVTDLKPRITVLGVGGAGGNAINNMIAAGLQGVEFVVANTDAQALAASSTDSKIQLGINLTEGMGAGSKPEIGEAAAEEAVEDIRNCIAGSHMLFIAAGMGGGTGTGAASVIARVARELGILTVAVVTKPFQFEGNRRLRIAEAGLLTLKDVVDTLIVIPNQNLFRIANERTTFAEAFVLADQVLYSGIACIVDLIIKEGLINLDLADVKTVLTGMGAAMMGTGEASGENRARLAAEEAILNPLLDDISLQGAKGLLVSIIGGHDLTLYEVDAAASRVRQEVDPDANIIVGATFDETLGDRVRVSIVASGMSKTTGQAATGHVHPQPGPSAIRGNPFGGVPPVSAAATPSNAKGPPPLPTTPVPSGPIPSSTAENSEFQRRLNDALEPGTGYASQFDGQLAHHPVSSTSTSALPSSASMPPHGSAVTLETRSPQFTGYIAAPGMAPYPMANDPAYPSTPTATDSAGTGRRPAARVAELSDFPPIAQHEFRAHMDQRSPKPVAQGSRTTDEQSKKPSLIQRITGAGRVRKANAADTRDSDDVVDELPGFLGRKAR